MKRLISALYNESSPFQFIFDEQIATQDPSDLKTTKASALIIWGGEDISPSIYGHELSSKTGAQKEPSIRDRLEMQFAKQAIELGIPIIGICRGAQLMCAVSGGTLIQHVTGHAIIGGHLVVTNDKKEFVTNSVHHQMLNPFKVDHELLAWCPTKLSRVYIGPNDTLVNEAYAKDFKEPEIVWFPKTKALCIQGHPEYGNAQLPFIRYCLKLVEERIFTA